MPGFMNDELRLLRDNLSCAHCDCIFSGSNSQARKVKYEHLHVYCSAACRHAAQRQMLSTPVPQHGPCPTCGKMFFSRRQNVIFCNMKCYKASEQFVAMLAQNRERMPHMPRPDNRETMKCLECGIEFYIRPSAKRTRKFCRTVCYRSYMAKRFDRWIASPEEMALPQAYDEFLDREELPCIVGSCHWRGRHLSLHVNQVHGLRVSDFKRAAGFNLKTGIIARPLAELLQARPHQGVAVNTFPDAAQRGRAKLASHPEIRGYKSNEGKEHSAKARLLMLADSPRPSRRCKACKKIFEQSTPFGKTLYCSRPCRDSHYREIARAKAKIRVRQEDGTFKWIAPDTNHN